ncbi:MAG: OmpP1/FadL family transporter [Planctomycetota bacterium]
MKRACVSTFVFILATNSSAHASGLESNGFGARGRTLGFAMVAVADDWTALHYNPAGLVQVDRSLCGFEYELFVGGMHSTASLRNLDASSANPYRSDFVDPYDGIPGIDEPDFFNEKEVDATIHSGAFGYITRRDRLAWGVGLYGSGSGTAWEDTITAAGDTIAAEISFTNGSLNVPMAVAWRLRENLALGLRVGVHYGLLEVTNEKIRAGAAPYVSSTTQDTDGVALSADIGLLWNPGGRISAGMVLKFPYTFTKDGTTRSEQSLLPLTETSGTTVDMDIPLRVVAGGAWRPSDRDLLAFSISWMNWSEYNIATDYETEGVLLTDSSGNPSNWEDAVVFGFGWERRITDMWTSRVGFAFDQAPEPEEARTLVGGQVVDTWKLGVGAGRSFVSSSLDFGYLLTYGPEVDGFIPGAKYGMTTHEFVVAYEHRF